MRQNTLSYPTPVVLVGAAPPDAEALAMLTAGDLPLVAADGGADVLAKLGMVPDAVIGDMDSVRRPDDLRRKGVDLRPSTDQDTTDFEKCAAQIDAPGILATGFTGGRMDHTLATMSVLARFPAGRIIVVGGPDLILRCPERIMLDLKPDTRFSLYPITRMRARSTGLEWALDALTLDPMGLIGTSNRTTGPVSLTLTEGTALLILPKRRLPVVRKALSW